MFLKKLNLIFKALTPREKRALFVASIILGIAIFARGSVAIDKNSEFVPVEGGSYKEGLVGQPIALNPVISQNPADQEISAIIYAPLLKLIVTHEVDQARRVYSLKLKEGLKWSDGEPLTSDDVVFTIRTIQDPDAHSPLFKNWQGIIAERVSELQVQLTLPAPYIFFESNFSQLLVIPQHAFGNIPVANLRLSSYNLEPVSSGPYKFESSTKRKDGFVEEMRFVRNDNFAGSKPFITRFSFHFYKDMNDVQKAFELRRIQGFGALNPVTVDAKRFPQAVVETIPMLRYYAIFFNGSVNPLLKKVELRSALSMSIDRDRVVKEVTGRNGRVISGPLFLDGSDNAPEYNPEAARGKIKSLKQASIEISLVVPNVDFLIRTAEIIKENWLSVGVTSVNIIALNPDDLINNVVRSRNYEAVIFGNVLENKFDLFSFWHSSQRFYPGINLALYQNTKVDQDLEKIRQDAGDLDREALLNDVVSQIQKDSPAAFLFSLPYTYVHAKGLGGIDFKYQYIKTPADRFMNVEKWNVLTVRLVKQ